MYERETKGSYIPIIFCDIIMLEVGDCMTRAAKQKPFVYQEVDIEATFKVDRMATWPVKKVHTNCTEYNLYCVP